MSRRTAWCLFALLTLTSAAAAQTMTSPAGTGEKGYRGDGGPAEHALLNNPFDVTYDRAGNLYFSDTFNHCVRRVAANGSVISTVAGCGRKGYSGDGGPAASAELNEPYGVDVDVDGNLYIVDRLNTCIRRVDAKGTITTIAGNGKKGYSGDGGLGAKAQLREPNGIALDQKGKLYIADVADQRVRVVDLASGNISTFCGTGEKRHSGDDGPIDKATLFGPRAVAVGPDGSLYICEREGNCIRKCDLASGRITRVAGTGQKGFQGDGGSALKATFSGPKELDVDRQGNIFVVDTENHAIRRVDAATGTISTVAGNGQPGGDAAQGSPLASVLNRPHGVAVSPKGGFVVGDTQNHRIRSVR